MAEAVSVFARILRQSKSYDAKESTMKALTRICHDVELITLVLENGLAHDIVALLGDERLKRHALRTVGDIARGTVEQARALIDAGFLLKLDDLLRDQNRWIRQDSVRALGHILRASADHISLFLPAYGDVTQKKRLGRDEVWNALHALAIGGIRSERLVRRDAISVLAYISRFGTDHHVLSFADDVETTTVFCEAILDDDIDYTSYEQANFALSRILQVKGNGDLLSERGVSFMSGFCRLHDYQQSFKQIA